ncbi:MAG: glycosyltransferase [Flavobacterium sp.]|uniref:glycosyltransferase family 4 protein n=1 Tax=Flavobacterium sp. TaxID=239 RepID=UPI00120DEE12|nr:glycosyltransferase family 4 protein [Flavobacterium sp.]RZJ66080.1 MAG: glycosyltransferase [Flavobacterium sp.]
MATVILLSTFPLPYSKIGSWTTMYKNYMADGDHQIDYIVCHDPVERFPNVEYSIVNDGILTKISREFTFYKAAYLKALEKIIKPGGKYIIQLVDNFQMAYKVDAMLREKGMRDNCYLQIFYHGFSPFLPADKSNFYSIIDELVVLTHDSYRAHLDFYTVFTCRVSVLYNGIDTKKFSPVSKGERYARKQLLGHGGKKLFLWLAQDRPKKGLNLILDAWREFHSKFGDTELMIVGAMRDKKQKGVTYYGQIPNDELPKYYQAADCYLFPTLCHEGFGLSLIEALNSGCYCIASKLGGVPEVLDYGKYGRLIENPNFKKEWVKAMADFMDGAPQIELPEQGLYTKESWNSGMNAIIKQAKSSLE